MSDFVRTTIGNTSRYTPAVAESGDGIGGDTIGGVNHINQFAKRTLYLMFAAQFAVSEKTFPEVAVRNRPFLEGPFVAIGHHKNHRTASSFCDEFFEGVHSSSFVLPRPFVAVDAVDKEQRRNRLRTGIVNRRQIDICAAEDTLATAEPRRMNDLTLCGVYGFGGPGA